MRRMIAIGLVCLLLGLAVPAAAADLHITLAINSGVFACDDQVHYYVWWNPEPVAIRLAWTRVWQGASYGAKSDFFVNLYVYLRSGQYPPYQLLHMVGWDHYADPTAPMASVWSYDPHWVTLQPGQGILMETACYRGVTPNAQAHAAAFVAYTR